MSHAANRHLPAPIQNRLSRLRRSIRWYIWAEGLTRLVAWLGVAFWFGLALDYLPVLVGASEMPREARTAFLILSAGIAGFVVYRYIFRRTFTRLADRSLALLLERRFPEFNDSLVTAVDTSPDEVTPASEALRSAMLAHAVNAAERTAKHVDISRVFDFRPLTRSALSALVAVVSIGLFALLAQDAFAIWTSRLMLASDAPWPRRASIEVLEFADKQRKIAEGSDLVLRVRADATRPTPPPTVCTIVYQTESGEAGRVNMSRDGEARDGFQYYRYEGQPFQGMLEDVQFDVIGFDHRVADYEVTVVASPAITQVRLVCQLPSYMDAPDRQLIWQPGLSLPIGTNIRLEGLSTKPLKSAQVTSLNVEGQSIKSTELEQDATRFQADLGTLQETTSLDIEMLDTDDVPSEQPYRVTINALEDLAPQVNLRLLGIGTAITPIARLPVSGEIKDDYGVQRAYFQVTRLDNSQTSELDLDLGLDGSVDATLDLRKERVDRPDDWLLEPGQQVLFSVHATDYFDLGDERNLGQSENLTLDVVTADELLARLEARELGLKRRFEQTLRELIDTRDSLLRLQTLLAPDAAAPETDTPDDESADTEPDDADDRLSDSQLLSLNRLRVQRAQQQAAKAQQEVAGVAASFDDIRNELINNRVDTPEREQRLADEIVRPLELVVADNFNTWMEQLSRVEDAVGDSSLAGLENRQAIQQANEIIFALQAVLQKMVELETFNELIDLVRSVIEEQEAILKDTEDARKSQELDILLD